ncbi:MAG TPA: LuxR C-terminal-related transcriptional regulator, partial [Alphaproteobacteria bacterium]|nr:LuxR C-terminal-related transcriptional regulator [Alphaproteobacteria bacterium]
KFLTFVPQHRRKAGLAYLRTFTPDRPYQELQHEAVLPDGTTRWTWWRDHAIFDDQGRIVSFQSVGRDITKEKLTELALRDAEERLLALERGSGGPAEAGSRTVAILSRRERQVARLMAEGKTNKQIATALNLQVPSIKVYATSIFRKLEVRNRTEAAAVLLSRPQENHPN